MLIFESRMTLTYKETVNSAVGNCHSALQPHTWHTYQSTVIAHKDGRVKVLNSACPADDVPINRR